MPGSGGWPGWGQRPGAPAPVTRDPDSSSHDGPVEERTPTLQEQGLPAPAPAPVQPPPSGQDGAYNPYTLPPMPGQLPRKEDREAYPMPPFGG